MTSLIACLWLHALASVPQTVTASTGTIIGKVTDSTGAPLPAVIVVVTGAAMIGQRSASTDREGRYVLYPVPPGDYTVTFTRAGYATHIREGVHVSLAFTANVDQLLQVAASPEEVVVTAGTPLIDPRSTALGTTMNAAALADLPGSRSLGAVLQAAPSVYLGRIDVGGALPTAGVYGAYGTFGFNRPLVEGISISGINSFGVPLDYGAFEEASVGTGSSGVEWPAPGVHVQFSSRSGGNQYHGGVYLDVEPRAWQSFNVDAGQIALSAAGNPLVPAREANRVWSYHDANADVGGYVVRNRLWWYGSLRQQLLAARLVTFPVVPHETRVQAYTGKVTSLVAANHRLIVFGQGGQADQPTRLDPFGQGGLTGPTAIHLSAASTADSRAWGGIWKAEWNAEIRDDLFFEVRGGQFVGNRRERPNGVGPRIEDVVRFEVTGGGRDWQNKLQRDQLRGVATYAPSGRLASHFLKFGVEVERILTLEAWHRGYPGDVLHVVQDRTPREVYLLQTPSMSQDGTWWLAAHASDTWQVKRTTINAGLRLDRHRLFRPPQVHPAGPFNTEQVFPEVDSLIAWTDLAPRLGVVFDVTGSATTLIKASFSRYLLPNTEGIASSANPNPGQWWRRYAWSDPNGSGEWEPGEQGGSTGARGGIETESLAPDLDLPFVNEVTAFVERVLRRGLAAHTGVVWRGERGHYQRVNASQPPEAFSVPATVSDPGPDGRFGTDDDRASLPAWQVAPEYLMLPARNVVQNVPGSASDFWTWELGVRLRDHARWSLTGGVAHTWTREQASAYLGQNVRQNRQARTPNDFINTDADGRHVFRVWSAKLSATYAGPWDVRVTPLLRHQSGQPFGRIFTVPLNYSQTVPMLAEPIGARRMRHITLVDARVEKGFRLANAARVAGFVDAFNIFNANPEQNVAWTSATFLRPLSIISPRIFRLGLKVAW